jgi:signal transduction histidine kinase
VHNQINIYRVVQELMSNAAKHARASDIFLPCSQAGSLFLMMAKEDGTGLDMGC